MTVPIGAVVIAGGTGGGGGGNGASNPRSVSLRPFIDVSNDGSPNWGSGAYAMGGGAGGSGGAAPIGGNGGAIAALGIGGGGGGGAAAITAVRRPAAIGLTDGPAGAGGG